MSAILVSLIQLIRAIIFARQCAYHKSRCRRFDNIMARIELHADCGQDLLTTISPRYGMARGFFVYHRQWLEDNDPHFPEHLKGVNHG